MKPLISKLSEYNSIVFFPFTLLWRRPGVFIGVLIFLAATGCFRKFYQAGTTKGVSMAQIDSLKSAEKYFVVHFRDNLTYGITNLQLKGDTLTGELMDLPVEHSEALKVRAYSTSAMRGKYAKSILREVHIYTNNVVDPNSRTVSIPRNGLYRMDIYEFDKGRTTQSTVVSIIGIVVFIALVILTISASSTPAPTPPPGEGCNCPKIHIQKDGQFEYVNGVFSGAVYSNLERSDILPLENLEPDSNISIRITNTPGEKQFINTVSLIAVKHDPLEKVLADRKGEFFKLDRFDAAAATDQKGNNISGLLSMPDNSPFSFDQDLDKEGPSSTILEFDYPTNSTRASLMIRARNTEWAATLTQTYVSLFGNKLSQWRDHIEKTKPSIMEQRELEQNLPIAVYVQNGDKWEFVDYFPLTGSTAYRNLVMSIPVPATNTTAILKIKLETVFNFWHLDQVVLDPQPETPVDVLVYEVASGSNAKDLKAQLSASDRNYLVINDDRSIDLNFSSQKIDSRKGTTSYFLKASGYYHYEDKYMGDPDMSRLQDFKTPGAFSRFSKQQYKEYLFWANAIKK